MKKYLLTMLAVGSLFAAASASAEHLELGAYRAPRFVEQEIRIPVTHRNVTEIKIRGLEHRVNVTEIHAHYANGDRVELPVLRREFEAGEEAIARDGLRSDRSDDMVFIIVHFVSMINLHHREEGKINITAETYEPLFELMHGVLEHDEIRARELAHRWVDLGCGGEEHVMRLIREYRETVDHEMAHGADHFRARERAAERIRRSEEESGHSRECRELLRNHE